MGTVLRSYLGWRRFPKELSEFEIRYFFSFSAADRRELRRRYRTKLRVAAALQLGFVRMTGNTLDAVDHVPRAVLKHVGQQLKLAAPELATLRAWYRRPRTLFHAWACRYAGFRWPDKTDEVVLVEDLIAACSATLDKDRLVRVAHERLFERHRLIPRRRAVEDWVRCAVRIVELDDRRLLERTVARRVREAWTVRLLAPHASGRMTMLEWLRRPPRKRSSKTLKEEAAKLCFIHSLSPPGHIHGIPGERVRAYDRRMARRRPAKVRQISEPRRTLEIAAVVSVLATRKSDAVLRLVEMRIAAIWRWAYALQCSEPRAALSEAVAQELAASVDDPRVSAEEYRERSRALLVPWCPGGSWARPTRARRMRELLATDRRRIRPLLRLILRLGLQGMAGDPVVRALRELAEVYRWGPAELFEGATAPIGYAWNELIANEDRAAALRAYEAATLWGVRRGLRNGSLWLPYAEQYGGRHRLLLPDVRWEIVRESFRERCDLPDSADPFLDRLLDQVNAGLQAVASAADAEDLTITDGGRVILNDEPTMGLTRHDATAVSAQLYTHVGKVQLPELLLAMDSETHFTWRLLGRMPLAPEELLPVYAAIIAAAMGLDATEVSMMIPAVRPSSIRIAAA